MQKKRIAMTLALAYLFVLMGVSPSSADFFYKNKTLYKSYFMCATSALYTTPEDEPAITVFSADVKVRAGTNIVIRISAEHLILDYDGDNLSGSNWYVYVNGVLAKARHIIL